MLDPASGARQVEYVPWTLLTPQPGYAEFDCGELWASILECVRRLRDEKRVPLSQVRAVGFCALCPGLIALDAKGRELSRCIIFMDARSGAEAAEINARIPRERSFQILGNTIMSGATSVTTMRWFRFLDRLHDRLPRGFSDPDGLRDQQDRQGRLYPLCGRGFG